MDTKDLATLLLIGHCISVAVTLEVLRRQVRIFRQSPDPKLSAGRWVLLGFALAILLGNFVPITVDILVLADVVPRNPPTPIGILYSLSNVWTLIVQSIALLALYVIAKLLLNRNR